MSGTITHEWNGTVLTITSDSGTSSADLKGTKGDTGARGVRGLAGADGITSVNGKKGDITLTAADVGAEKAGTAESVRTQIEAWVEDGYLPLTGGTLTGSLTVNDNIYSKGILVSQTNSYPGLTIQNASGANLAMLYSNGTNGGYSNTILRVYSAANKYSSFSFGKDGALDFGGVLRSGSHAIKGNSYPTLAFTDLSVSKTLAYLQPQTSAGEYAEVLLAVKNNDGQSNFYFGKDGVFVAPVGVESARIYSKTNNYPQMGLYNGDGNPLSLWFVNTTSGGYGDARLRVNSSASAYSTFSFGNDGKLSCGSLALSSPLTVANGGTGSTTAAGARSNLGVEYAKYSTAETDTGNKWIDGKTIYRAVVSGTTSLSNSLGDVGTLPSAVATPVSIRAYAKGDDGAWRVIPNAYHGDSTWDAMIYINGNTIVMSFGSSWTQTRDFVVIVEYTK